MALLYFALVSTAVGIATWNFVQDYDSTRTDIEDRAQAYAVSMATDVRWYVDVARQSLARVIEKFVSSVDEGDHSAALEAAVGDLPMGVVIVVYDETGSSVSFLGQTSHPVNISDREYFASLRDGEPWVISNLISDRVTNTMTFAVGMPIVIDGAFRGAAVAYAPMAVLSNAWLSVGGEDSNAFLIHRDGWLTARLPPVDTDVYDSRVSDVFTDRFFEKDSGSYWAEASPIDGIARVLGYSRVPNTPLAAVIGISPEEAMGKFWSRVMVLGAVLAPLFAILGFAAWRGRNLIIANENAAYALAKSNERNSDLLMEIHHRVKNNLQSVLSLIRLHIKDPAVVKEIQPRILAMITAHEIIYRKEDYSEVSARTYITELAQKTIYASSEAIELQTDIADVALRNEIVMPIGQLVNEAVINAIKYGFADGIRGVIDIRLAVDASGRGILTIHDNGRPLPESVVNGTGSRLMRAFAMQLQGEVQILSDAKGVTVRLDFPL